MSNAPWCVGPSSPTRPGAIHRQHHRELLQADVVDDLVVRALQEGRVDRGDGPRALQRQAGREQQRLLLGDPDVEVAVGHRLLEDVEPRAGVHRRGDADDALVALALGHERVAEHRRVLRDRGLGGRRLGRRRGIRLAIEFGLAACHFSMPSSPPSSAGREPLALDRRAVDDDGALGLERGAQRAAQGAHVVAVDDAHVGPVELLPQEPRAPRTP